MVNYLHSFLINFKQFLSKFGDEDTISKYVREQGLEKEYKCLHKEKQLVLF